MFDDKTARFEQLVHAYSAELYRFAYWACRDRFVAEELVQETFTRAWTSFHSIRDHTAARSWLYTILRNEHARLYERRRVDASTEIDLDTLEDQHSRAAGADLELREALHELPESYREPLLLQVLGGFSCEEIARIVKATPGAIMTRLSRARLALRRSGAFQSKRAAR